MNSTSLLPLVALVPAATCLAERPNIIYIMTDQQTANAMSCAGNTDVTTPNLDRLAAFGVRFTNAYATAPLSGPCRASMFTGLYPSEMGLMSNGTPLPDSLKSETLGVLMQKAGYTCGYAGKWHIHTSDIPDAEFGFEALHPHVDFGLAEAVVDFIERKHTQPFFVVASFDNPHNICEYARNQNLPFTTIQEPPIEECPGLPENFAKNPYDAEIIGIEQALQFRTYPVINYTSDDWRRYRNAYYRMVETVDAQIGVIIDALDKNNLWKNSVIIFTSDHGDGNGSHQWNQKSALYQEVVNIPFIVTLPYQKNRGKVVPHLVNNGIDFYASVCDWAGIELPTGRYGVSVRRVAEKAQSNIIHQSYIVTETLFDNSNTRGWMVRTANYKYVLYDKGRYREQLFDMRTDSGEMRNLAIEKKSQQLLLQHRAILQDWMEKQNIRGIGKRLGHIPGY